MTDTKPGSLVLEQPVELLVACGCEPYCVVLGTLAVSHVVWFWACWFSFGSEPSLVVLSEVLRGGGWSSLQLRALFGGSGP